MSLMTWPWKPSQVISMTWSGWARGTIKAPKSGTSSVNGMQASFWQRPKESQKQKTLLPQSSLSRDVLLSVYSIRDTVSTPAVLGGCWNIGMGVENSQNIVQDLEKKAIAKTWKTQSVELIKTYKKWEIIWLQRMFPGRKCHGWRSS